MGLTRTYTPAGLHRTTFINVGLTDWAYGRSDVSSPTKQRLFDKPLIGLAPKSTVSRVESGSFRSKLLTSLEFAAEADAAAALLPAATDAEEEERLPEFAWPFPIHPFCGFED